MIIKVNIWPKICPNREVLHIWLKFLLDRYCIKQAVREILSKHYTQVHKHQKRAIEIRLYQHLFKFNKRRRARRPTPRSLSIRIEFSGQPKCGN